jgi:ATP-dependent Clp protease ATP-binding subunit ClpC
MFERFTERARQTIVLAQEHARELQHTRIGTEHLLLGLLGADGSIAAVPLARQGLTTDRVQAEVVRLVARGAEPSPRQIPFTANAKQVLEHSLQEGQALHQRHVGTGHILLALVGAPETTGGRALHELGADLGQLRQETLSRLGEPRPPGD